MSTNAVATQSQTRTVAAMIESRKDELAKMLPSMCDPSRMMKIFQMCSAQPTLLDCEPMSLLTAFGTCAQLGLEPNTPLQHVYILPFSKKDSRGQWVKQAQVIIGYRGWIDLACRSGKVAKIVAHAVHERDHFEYELGTVERIVHRPRLKDRGAPVAYYAVAHFANGTTDFRVMDVDQINRIRDRSQGYKKSPDSHPWKTDYDEMAKKTVIRNLVKYLPSSVEVAAASEADEALPVESTISDVPPPADQPKPAQSRIAAAATRAKTTIEAQAEPVATQAEAVSVPEQDDGDFSLPSAKEEAFTYTQIQIERVRVDALKRDNAAVALAYKDMTAEQQALVQHWAKTLIGPAGEVANQNEAKALAVELVLQGIAAPEMEAVA